MNPEQHRPQIEGALRTLESHGFDVKALWRELSTRVSTWERGTPSEDDTRYTLPSVQPDLLNHLIDGRNQDLHPSVMWNGYSYTLSPGQRSILRDTYGLTPTQTVTVAWVEAWPGTQYPRVMKLTSDLHIDPRNRKHVLVSAVINDVGTFFKTAAELDDAERTERRFGLTESSLEIGRIFTLTSEERWAVEDTTGVKIASKVEVTTVSSEAFTVLCQRTGNTARVARKAFFDTVAEYERLHESKPKRRTSSATDRAAMTMEAMLKSLES